MNMKLVTPKAYDPKRKQMIKLSLHDASTIYSTKTVDGEDAMAYSRGDYHMHDPEWGNMDELIILPPLYLQDKHGEEVYLNDILQLDDGSRVIVWNMHSLPQALHVQYIQEGMRLYYVEVVGSIHDRGIELVDDDNATS